jgi:hypothetical protein
VLEIQLERSSLIPQLKAAFPWYAFISHWHSQPIVVSSVMQERVRERERERGEPNLNPREVPVGCEGKSNCRVHMRTRDMTDGVYHDRHNETTCHRLPQLRNARWIGRTYPRRTTRHKHQQERGYYLRDNLQLNPAKRMSMWSCMISIIPHKLCKTMHIYSLVKHACIHASTYFLEEIWRVVERD